MARGRPRNSRVAPCSPLPLDSPKPGVGRVKHWQELGQILDRVLLPRPRGPAGRPRHRHAHSRLGLSPARREAPDRGGRLAARRGQRRLPGGGRATGRASGSSRSGLARRLHYETGDDDTRVWGLGLGCDGEVDIVVSPSRAEAALGTWARVRELLDGDAPFALSTVVEDGGRGQRGRRGGLGPARGPSRRRGGGCRGRARGGDGAARPTLEPSPRRCADRLHRGPAASAEPARVRRRRRCPAPRRLRRGGGLPRDRRRSSRRLSHRRAFSRSAPAAARCGPSDESAELPADRRTYAVVMTHSLKRDTEWVRRLLGDRRAVRRRPRPAGADGEDPGRAGASQPGADLRARRPRPGRGRARAGGAEHRGRAPRGVRPAASRATCASGRWPSMPTERADTSAAVVLRRRLVDADGPEQAAPRPGRGDRRPAGGARGDRRPAWTRSWSSSVTRSRACAPSWPGLPCTVVVNPDHAQGAGTSVRTGVRQVAADGGRDRGRAGRHAVRDRGDDRDAGRALPRHAARRWSSRTTATSRPRPTLYDRALFAELLQIPGERCAKQVVRRHESEAVVVAWPESALRDIDVPADYEGVRAPSWRGG